jgi:hypothetical protein
MSNAGTTQNPWFNQTGLPLKPVGQLPVYQTLGVNPVTLTPAQSGGIVSMSSTAHATPLQINLPSATGAPGCSYIIVDGGVGLSAKIVSSPSANMYGMATNIASGGAGGLGALDFGAAVTNLNFTSTSQPGDWASMWNDGSKWYCQGISVSTVGPSFTAFS